MLSQGFSKISERLLYTVKYLTAASAICEVYRGLRDII